MRKSRRRRGLIANAVLAMAISACSDGGGTTTGPRRIHLIPDDFALSATMDASCASPGVQIPIGAKDTLYHLLTGVLTNYSSNSSVASVPSSGYPVVVTAHTLGQACISVSSSNGGFAQSLVTVVTPQVTTVSVSPTSAFLLLNATTQLTATAREQQGNPMPGVSFTWSTSNSSVASVSSSGLVTGIGSGQAIITATAGGLIVNATVTVGPPVVSISGPQYIARFQSGQYSASVSGGISPYTYQWRSRDGSAYSWGAWSSWYSTGTTSFTFASISACGIDRKQIEVKVTDSQPAQSNVGNFTLFLTNPC